MAELAATEDFLARVHGAVEAAYPRPGLVREQWLDLSGEWEFAFDDGDLGEDEGWYEAGAPAFGQTIIVPYPFESRRSGIGDAGPHGVVWYRRWVTPPEHSSGEQVLLNFGAVDYRARVYCDGRLLGEHAGGHTPFTLVLSPRAGEKVCLVVRAEDRPDAVDQPRGKQDWRDEPHSVWYGRTSGIWQPVWMEVVSAVHLMGVEFTSDLALGLVRWSARLNRHLDGFVRVRFSIDSSVVAEQTQSIRGTGVSSATPIPPFGNAWEWENLEWSPETPRLVGVEITVLDGAGKVVDEALSYLGIREVGSADGQFLLNRQPYFQRLVLSQGYWPDTRLAAPSRQALREEVELIKSLGFNGARIHQKLEDPAFLFWCDRLGLLVWEELPSAGTFSPVVARRLLDEWMEAVERDRGHPCVVVWVPFNESWGAPAMAGHPERASLVAAAAELTRALDQTRLVVSNDGWEHVNSDLFTVHDYAPDGASLLRRYSDAEARGALIGSPWPAVRALVHGSSVVGGLPVLVSEFGGIALTRTDDDEWHGYYDVSDAGALLKRLEELFGALNQCEGLAGFCYTQLTDTEQEENGLAWPTRVPKASANEIAALVQARPSA